jgi:hypothetical protein
MAKLNVIQFVTISSTSDASDWGDLTVARNGNGRVNGDGRIAWGGGTTGSNSDVIDYISTALGSGSASDFGNLSASRRNVCGCGNTTRGVFMGGCT